MDVEFWASQYDEQWRGVPLLDIMLLLRGGTQQGKSMKAKSIMGEGEALLVKASGLGSVLPDLSALHDPDRNFRVVVFDEINGKRE